MFPLNKKKQSQQLEKTYKGKEVKWNENDNCLTSAEQKKYFSWFMFS